MKWNVLFILLLLAVKPAHAQDELFGIDSSVKAHSGFILNGNITADIPLADMAKRFGVDYRLGPAVTYKTKSNWVFGAKCDFLLGNLIKEDSLMINIKDKYSGKFNGKVVQLLNISGERTGVTVYERGYLIGLQAGKIINLKPGHPDNGLFFLTSVGFIQHKITIYNKERDVAQVDGALRKGYDRLTNGWFAEQFAGYTYFARNGLLNFNVGLDVMLGFTRGRRDYLYDVMRTDDKQRLDMLLGIRGGWMIPVFKRKSEDLNFQ